MGTSAATFALMRQLTPAERAEVECRYDGAIPTEAVTAIIARRDRPAVTPAYSPVELEAQRRDLEYAAQSCRTVAAHCLRQAKRAKGFGAQQDRTAEDRRRTRETVARYVADARERHRSGQSLRRAAAGITTTLTTMMADALKPRAAAE